MSRWLAQQTDDGAHVLPIDDQVDHVESDDCVCGPAVEYVTGEQGSGWLITHHSLDGREHHEEIS
ncbi:MAG: hypothetical protein K0Q93_3149 [Nocardioidaceae bacterium]|jgi:hypothetical protein|nr:hypothetical protein [Nocardioidaceae bacterium]